MQSDNICLLTLLLKPLTFNIMDITEFKPAIYKNICPALTAFFC